MSLLVPCALVLGTLAVFLPGPAALLGAAAGLLARYARWIALALGRFPFASLSTDSVYCLIWLGAAYLALAAAFLGRERPRRPLLGAGMAAILLCAAIGLGRLEADGADLTAAALDVGQGSATVLQSGGRTALVDCGGSGSRSAGDIAADHFAAQGRVRLDLLVLTHFDSDHCNGVEQLFYRMRVDRVAVPAGDTDPEAAARLMELAEAEGAQVVLVEGTERLPLGEAELTLFPPLGGGTSNESGLFVLCTAGEFDVLITGDADAFVEKMLVKYQPIPDIEVLVAGHHGSKHSSCGEFLQAAAPEIALISAGANNSYGHPAQETLERLEELGEGYAAQEENGGQHRHAGAEAGHQGGRAQASVRLSRGGGLPPGRLPGPAEGGHPAPGAGGVQPPRRPGEGLLGGLDRAGGGLPAHDERADADPGGGLRPVRAGGQGQGAAGGFIRI